MTNTEKNKAFYNFAYNFLIEKTPNVITEKIIQSYLVVPSPENSIHSLNTIFERMLESAQNRQMSVNVIGGAIGGVHKLGSVLKDFDVNYVLKTFPNEVQLLEVIEKEFTLKGKIRVDKKSLWPKYCKTIISTATFLSQFKDSSEFLSWIKSFYNDDKSMAVLPLLISTEVYGFGFALVCDFLKELGFINYGKPDVHIKDILTAYKFIPEKATDYSVLKTMIVMSKDAGVSCYDFDKVLWLIGSGRFYNNPEIGKNGSIGRMKEDFISLWPDFEKIAK